MCSEDDDKRMRSNSNEELRHHLKDSLTFKDKPSKRDRESSEDTEMGPNKVSRSSSLSFNKRRSASADSEHRESYKAVISSKSKIVDLPQAPSPGTIGRRTSLKVNCFRVHCKTEQISMYNVVFDPPLPADSIIRKQSIVNRFYDKIKQTYGIFLFENMRLWALKSVKEDVEFNDPNVEHALKISYTKSVVMKNAPYDEFNQIIHIIFQKAVKNAHLVKIGRNYYDKNTLNDEKFLLSRERLRLFRGYSMNIEQSVQGLHLVVDISHRVISIDSIATFIDGVEDNLSPRGDDSQGHTPRNERGGNDSSSRYSNERGRGRGRGSPFGSSSSSRRDFYGGTSSSQDNRERKNTPELQRKVEEELIGRCVITTYRMKNWRIDEIDWTQNIDSTFTWVKKNGQSVNISYRNYFMENYRLKLTNERFGMLVNLPKIKNSKSRRNKGPDRFVLPPEACYLTGISKKMKADFGLMKRIRDVVSLKPNQRYNGVSDIVKYVSRTLDEYSSSDGSGNKEESENYLKIDIEPRGISVEGRIQEETSLKLNMGNPKNLQTVRSKDLMRNWTRAGCVNPNPHTVAKWVVIHERRYNQQANQLIHELMQASRQFRLMEQPIDVLEVNANPRGKGVFASWKDVVEFAIKNIKNLQLIVAVIPNHFKSDDVYSAIKTATLLHEQRLIPSQCIKAQRFDRRNQRSLRSVISSTLKQILTKRGNVPWIVNFNIKGSFNPFDGKTMLCGIDINHDVKRNRSTAGFCVSGDRRFSRYETYVSLSLPGKEIINGAEKCMVKSLLNFFNEAGHLPQHVVVYRDGVSNSELSHILATEVQAFRKSFQHKAVKEKASGKPYNPKLTFIIVQKRVSLRIFDRELNSAMPGTVVDGGITSSRFWDFYMLATRAPPGKTSRPTRYIVLYDDYGVKSDDIQSFTHQLCHTYYNFPGPIRVPAPCQIAHQVAYLYGSIASTRLEKNLFTPKCRSKAYYL